jgi:hypothetical protein
VTIKTSEELINTNSDRVKALRPVGVCLCVGLIIWLCVQGVPLSSLYIWREGWGATLVLVGYNWGVLDLLQSLTFIIFWLGRSSLLEVHAFLVRVLRSWPWARDGPLDRSRPDTEPYRSRIDKPSSNSWLNSKTFLFLQVLPGRNKVDSGNFRRETLKCSYKNFWVECTFL